ncbi:hypothetical protein GGS21DRAFT_291756 [Xylaria nigripes]|nr:hypothetical protein GGS21DRAFT_291756 [Xylaria nigripes]
MDEWASMYKTSWSVKPFNRQAHEILKCHKGCDEVWAYAVLNMQKRGQDGEMQDSILVVKLAKPFVEPAPTSRRQAEEYDVWHLPGGMTHDNDPSILWRLWAQVVTDLYVFLNRCGGSGSELLYLWGQRANQEKRNVYITKFTQAVHREIMVVSDQDGQGKRILVLTFAADITDGRQCVVVNKQRYETQSWACKTDFANHLFRVRRGTFRQALLSYLTEREVTNSIAKRSRVLWNGLVDWLRYGPPK